MAAHMTSFRSSEELFQAVRDLRTRLEHSGHHQADTGLREGFGCLNGLTRGGVLFLQPLERVRPAASRRFDRDDEHVLQAIRAAAHAAVHRR
jgi:hypothetical protein